MFGSITCTDGSVWLLVDTEFDISVHSDAELDELVDILQPWIDSGELPTNTIVTLTNYINDHRNRRMIPWEAFPQLFKDMSKTYDELVDLGLLRNPAMFTP